MMSFPAYATDFELHPHTGEAFGHLSSLFDRLTRVEFLLRVDDPKVNQGQMASDFDRKFGQALQMLGVALCPFPLPSDLPQELDFAFTFANKTVAVEIEKANREKILRDILKCHIYLHVGADYAVVALPRNYPHKHGVWDLFDFGVQRFDDCQRYGFGTPDKLGRILLLGFRQFDANTNEVLSVATRKRMRDQAAKEPANGASLLGQQSRAEESKQRPGPFMAELSVIEEQSKTRLDDESIPLLARLRQRGVLQDKEWNCIQDYLRHALTFLARPDRNMTKDDEGNAICCADADPRNGDWIRVVRANRLAGYRLPTWAALWLWWLRTDSSEQFWYEVGQVAREMGCRPFESPGEA